MHLAASVIPSCCVVSEHACAPSCCVGRNQPYQLHPCLCPLAVQALSLSLKQQLTHCFKAHACHLPVIPLGHKVTYSTRANVSSQLILMNKSY